MKMIKKLLLTVAFAIPMLAGADTYDDLISATKAGNASEVSTLVNKGASIDTTDIDGNTLLILAARDGHVELVEYLIKHRAKLNARNSAGDTAMRIAAFRGQLKIVELLVAGGAAVNMHGWTPLAYASFAGHLDIARLLIKSGADVNLPNLVLDTGETALDLATRFNNTDIFDLLRKAGGKSGRTATIEVR